MFEKYVDTNINCECGQTHRIPIKNITIKEDALLRVPGIQQWPHGKNK